MADAKSVYAWKCVEASHAKRHYEAELFARMCMNLVAEDVPFDIDGAAAQDIEKDERPASACTKGEATYPWLKEQAI